VTAQRLCVCGRHLALFFTSRGCAAPVSHLACAGVFGELNIADPPHHTAFSPCCGRFLPPFCRRMRRKRLAGARAPPTQFSSWARALLPLYRFAACRRFMRRVLLRRAVPLSSWLRWDRRTLVLCLALGCAKDSPSSCYSDRFALDGALACRIVLTPGCVHYPPRAAFFMHYRAAGRRFRLTALTPPARFAAGSCLHLANMNIWAFHLLAWRDARV